MKFIASDEFRGKDLEPMFCSKQPTHILVSNLGRPTKPADIKSLPLKEFCQKEKISWCESPMISVKLRDQSFANQGYNKAPNELTQALFVDSRVADVLLNPREDLVICKMDDRIGQGLMLNPYSKRAIKAGEIIGVYPGICSQNNALAAFLSGESEFSSYGFEVDPGVPVNTIGKAYNDAKVWRNHFAFMQHAPGAETLNSIKIEASLKRKVVTRNVMPLCTLYMGLPVLLLMALCDIDPGKHLYIDYGESYWRNPKATADGKGAYFLFDDNARIVGKVDSSNKFKAAKNVNMKAAEIKRSKISEDEAVQFYRDNIKIPLTNYQPLFITNVRLVIEQHANRKPQGEILTCLNRMLSIDTTDVEKFFVDIATIINSQEFKGFKLKHLSEEITLLLHAFNKQRSLVGKQVLDIQGQQSATTESSILGAL